MSRTSTATPILLICLAATALVPTAATAQLATSQARPLATRPANASSPDAALARALAANPITAPYGLTTRWNGRQVVIAGVVGDSGVHTAAIRTAIALGIPVSDQIVIDTAASYQVAARGVASGALPPPASILTSYTYPPPLFGRYDEPFFGMEPPLTQFPAWWGSMTAARVGPAIPPGAGPMQVTGPGNEVAAIPPLPGLPPNTIEAVIDPLGVAILRGVVPTEADRIAAGQRLAQMPGVSQVINRLTVGPVATVVSSGPVHNLSDTPPPPPTPADVKVPRDPVEPSGLPIRMPADRPAVANSTPAPAPAARPEAAKANIDPSVKDRAELAEWPIRVSIRDGVASISGSVPTVYEAMLAFRAVQQTPGVTSIADSLRFTVPDGSTANPLLAKARREDVEPYLDAQIRRQVGGLAQLERVEVAGDQLLVKGTIRRPDDRSTVEGILRSMPILRGFKILPELRPLAP